MIGCFLLCLTVRNVGNKHIAVKLPKGTKSKRSDVVIGFSDMKGPTAGRVYFPFGFVELKKDNEKIETRAQLARYMQFGLDALSVILGEQARCYGATICRNTASFYQLRVQGTENSYEMVKLQEITLDSVESISIAAVFFYKLISEAIQYLKPILERLSSEPNHKSVGKNCVILI